MPIFGIQECEKIPSPFVHCNLTASNVITFTKLHRHVAWSNYQRSPCHCMELQVIPCETCDMFAVTTLYVLWCHAVPCANTCFSPTPSGATSLPVHYAVTCVRKITCVHPCHVVNASRLVEVDHCNCFVGVVMSFRSDCAPKAF